MKRSSHLIALFSLWFGFSFSAEPEPVLHVPFDEGAGVVAWDVSSPLRDLKFDGAGWTNGKSKSALYLDGSSRSIIPVVFSREKSFGTKDFTLSFWARPSSQDWSSLKDKRRRLISLVDGYPDVWAVVDLLENGQVRLEIGSKKDGATALGFSVTAKSKLLENEWTHLTFVFARSENKMRIHFNGSLDAEAAIHADFKAELHSSRPMLIGSTWQNFIGAVDELRLHHRILPEPEIQGLPNQFFKGTVKPVGATAPIQIKRRTENLAVSKEYFVSPLGNDLWTGRLAEPNAGKTDGPFASMGGAQEMIRGLKAAGKLSGAVTVHLRGGTYRITQTLHFVPEDSGTKDAPITYAAYKNEKPVVSGGKKVVAWRKAESGTLEADLPEVKNGDFYFQELFVGPERAKRTRLPKKGFYKMKDLEKDSNLAFFFDGNDLKPWKNITDVNLVAYHAWTASVHWIKEVDASSGKVQLQNPSQYIFGRFGGKNGRYYVENVREALTDPGEWYLDRSSGILTYLPRPGETAENLDAVYPVVDRILNFVGDPKTGAFVEHLNFQGISFRHSDWGILRTAKVDGQAHVSTRNAMVFAKGLRNSRFENCEFMGGGVHAIWLEQGSSDNTISKAHIFDFGGGGIYLGDTGYFEDEKMRADRNVVDNSFLHRLNLLLHGAHGIWIGKSSFNRISHNEISDLDYSPIAAGWTWGFNTPSGVAGNIFEYNHLHHYGLGELSDMAGIYTLGKSPGTVERYNIVHDANAYSYGGWGLYTDEGSSDILLENNLVYNTKSGGFHQHYGSNCLIRNNIFAFSMEQNIVSMRGDEQNKSFIFEKNIVLTTNSFPANFGFKSEEFKIDKNLYWDLLDASLTNMSFGGMPWEEWRTVYGRDKNSLIADPLFVDPLRYDFRFKSGSPASKIGFVPFSDHLAKTGLYGDADWTSLPKKYTPRPVSEEMQAPQRKRGLANRFQFTEDFETIAMGVPPPFGKVEPGITVAAEEAFKSRHSLKFVDSPNNGKEWKPHLAFENRYAPGNLKGSFDLFLDDRGDLWHEWREGGTGGYKAGPSVRFEPSGDVVVDKKKLTTQPLKKWVRVEIDLVNGGKGTTWSLTLTVEGQPKQTFENLRHVNPEFQTLETTIWSSMSQVTSQFYIDNVHFEVTK